ncbi:arsenate reductase ArsC [Paraglaciecola hydrolytica]|uniref:Arsenate reductase n=1 Tax=Paraglaciecola hydrolytica TaxID=1799789 RepID=A0A148KM79_9ALTE|nr:arsenate reductase ArsC [Paraglaciecola hydrolytica]KXI27397.1 arsenate reductase [Paraglaciecola hydrolytica]
MKILYICTHNRCRSILSEAITTHLSEGLIEAKSAGSQPVGEVHPLSIKYLSEAGISVEGLQSQSWDEFEDFAPDVVVTVCDSAAGESCPVWFGNSIKVHWSLSDPSKIEGTESEKAAGFRACMQLISERVEVLKTIAAQQLAGTELRAALLKAGAI